MSFLNFSRKDKKKDNVVISEPVLTSSTNLKNPPQTNNATKNTTSSANAQEEKDRRMQDAIERMTKANEDLKKKKEIEQKQEEAESQSGIFNRIAKQIGFQNGEEEEEDIVPSISGPTDVHHEGHVGLVKGKFETRNLPPELQKLFNDINATLKTMGVEEITQKEARLLLKALPVLTQGPGTRTTTAPIKSASQDQSAAATTQPHDSPATLNKAPSQVDLQKNPGLIASASNALSKFFSPKTDASDDEIETEDVQDKLNRYKEKNQKRKKEIKKLKEELSQAQTKITSLEEVKRNFEVEFIKLNAAQKELEKLQKTDKKKQASEESDLKKVLTDLNTRYEDIIRKLNEDYEKEKKEKEKLKDENDKLQSEVKKLSSMKKETIRIQRTETASSVTNNANDSSSAPPPPPPMPPTDDSSSAPPPPPPMPSDDIKTKPKAKKETQKAAAPSKQATKSPSNLNSISSSGLNVDELKLGANKLKHVEVNSDKKAAHSGTTTTKNGTKIEANNLASILAGAIVKRRNAMKEDKEEDNTDNLEEWL